MTSARRRLALAMISLLAIPALAMPLAPQRTVSKTENRALAPAPARPASAEGWRTLPRGVDAYLADHFGFREDLTKSGRRLLRRIGGEVKLPEAVKGQDGFLFLTEGLLGSTGQDADPARTAAYAKFICEAQARLKADGAKVVFAIAPSPATIYPEKAPRWALPVKAPTDYDRVIAGVRACGGEAVDLRPSLWAAKGKAQLYRRTDSHWTPKGAVVAYNDIVAAFGEPGWRINSDTAVWATGPRSDGDLPRLAGLDPISEVVPFPALMNLAPGATHTPLTGVQARSDQQPFVIDSGKPGPVVLVIGDSYAQHYTAPLMANFVGKIAWAHHEGCGFDWAAVARLKPDHVLIMPVERYAFCSPGARPKNY